MGFEEFKERMVEGLKLIYGDDVEIITDVFIGNNGSAYNGIYIFQKGSGSRTTPVIDLDRLYRLFENGIFNIGDCIWDIYHSRAANDRFEEVEQLAESISDWESVKDDIYPLILSTEENRELLQKLVSTPMLDLSVIYTIRSFISGKGTVGIKITKKLLDSYGKSAGQLHEQAMENLEKDGYRFRDMLTVLKDLMNPEEIGAVRETEYSQMPEIYILTNRAGTYGAAGILNKKLIKEFAKGRDFIILPSSLHETIFVPVTEKIDKGYCDEMVSEVNRTVVDAGERLTDHSYYYDAEADEIRMCA